MPRLLLGGGGHRPPERRCLLIKEIQNFLGPKVKKILFVPFGERNYDGYTQLIIDLGLNAGYRFEPLYKADDLASAIMDAEAIFMGGGNTFRLLHYLERNYLIPLIAERVDKGTPYIGLGAGSNMACPTIRTTNDMPIVQPWKFDALGLIPFQINPHYMDPDPNSPHQGETRAERINQFHQESDLTVVGLREGGILRIEGKSIDLTGFAGAKVFRKGQPPSEHFFGEKMDFLFAG